MRVGLWCACRPCATLCVVRVKEPPSRIIPHACDSGLEGSREACLQGLLLGAALWVDREMAVLQGALYHGDGVGPLRLWVDALLCYDARHILEQTRELHIPLLLRNLHEARMLSTNTWDLHELERGNGLVGCVMGLMHFSAAMLAIFLEHM